MRNINRLLCNQEIIKILKQLVEEYPQLRFNQLLYNFEVTFPDKDLFYEESYETLERIQKELFKRNSNDNT